MNREGTTSGAHCILTDRRFWVTWKQAEARRGYLHSAFVTVDARRTCSTDGRGCPCACSCNPPLCSQMGSAGKLLATGQPIGERFNPVRL